MPELPEVEVVRAARLLDVATGKYLDRPQVVITDGRISAVGKAGEPADRDKLSIWFNGIRVATKGARDPSYDEAQVSESMKKPEIELKVALGIGKGRDRVLTCDLTKEYIAINGDYRS